MSNLNQFNFTGRLGADALVKQVGEKTLVEISVAIVTGFSDYKKTLWIKVNWWGERAANVAPIFKKGALVSGNGELSLNEYDGKDGKHYANVVVTVFGMNLEKGVDKQEPAQPYDSGVLF